MTEALDLSAVSKAVVAGDWHGSDGAARDVIERAAAQGIHTILHVGDFGIGPWGDSSRSLTKMVDAALFKARSVLLVVPGNHENHDRLDAAKRDDGGMIVLGKRLRALPFGHRFDLGGLRFGALGGAVSVDRERRMPGVSWWPQEAPTQADVNRLGDDPLDVLLTHDVPWGCAPLKSGISGIPDYLVAEADDVRRLLRQAVNRTRPRLVFAGHWHQRRIGTIEHPGGSTTTTHVLDEQYTPGNAAVLDLATLTVSMSGAPSNQGVA